MVRSSVPIIPPRKERSWELQVFLPSFLSKGDEEEKGRVVLNGITMNPNPLMSQIPPL